MDENTTNNNFSDLRNLWEQHTNNPVNLQVQSQGQDSGGRQVRQESSTSPRGLLDYGSDEPLSEPQPQRRNRLIAPTTEPKWIPTYIPSARDESLEDEIQEVISAAPTEDTEDYYNIQIQQILETFEANHDVASSIPFSAFNDLQRLKSKISVLIQQLLLNEPNDGKKISSLNFIAKSEFQYQLLLGLLTEKAYVSSIIPATKYKDAAMQLVKNTYFNKSPAAFTENKDKIKEFLNVLYQIKHRFLYGISLDENFIAFCPTDEIKYILIQYHLTASYQDDDCHQHLSEAREGLAISELAALLYIATEFKLNKNQCNKLLSEVINALSSQKSVSDEQRTLVESLILKNERDNNPGSTFTETIARYYLERIYANSYSEATIQVLYEWLNTLTWTDCSKCDTYYNFLTSNAEDYGSVRTLEMALDMLEVFKSEGRSDLISKVFLTIYYVSMPSLEETSKDLDEMYNQIESVYIYHGYCQEKTSLMLWLEILNEGNLSRGGQLVLVENGILANQHSGDLDAQLIFEFLTGRHSTLEPPSAEINYKAVEKLLEWLIQNSTLEPEVIMQLLSSSINFSDYENNSCVILGRMAANLIWENVGEMDLYNHLATLAFLGNYENETKYTKWIYENVTLTKESIEILVTYLAQTGEGLKFNSTIAIESLIDLMNVLIQSEYFTAEHAAKLLNSNGFATSSSTDDGRASVAQNFAKLLWLYDDCRRHLCLQDINILCDILKHLSTSTNNGINANQDGPGVIIREILTSLELLEDFERFVNFIRTDDTYGNASREIQDSVLIGVVQALTKLFCQLFADVKALDWNKKNQIAKLLASALKYSIGHSYTIRLPLLLESIKDLDVQNDEFKPLIEQGFFADCLCMEVRDEPENDNLMNWLNFSQNLCSHLESIDLNNLTPAQEAVLSLFVDKFSKVDKVECVISDNITNFWQAAPDVFSVCNQLDTRIGSDVIDTVLENYFSFASAWSSESDSIYNHLKASITSFLRIFPVSFERKEPTLINLLEAVNRYSEITRISINTTVKVVVEYLWDNHRAEIGDDSKLGILLLDWMVKLNPGIAMYKRHQEMLEKRRTQPIEWTRIASNFKGFDFSRDQISLKAENAFQPASQFLMRAEIRNVDENVFQDIFESFLSLVTKLSLEEQKDLYFLFNPEIEGQEMSEAGNIISSPVSSGEEKQAVIIDFLRRYDLMQDERFPPFMKAENVAGEKFDPVAFQLREIALYFIESFMSEDLGALKSSCEIYLQTIINMTTCESGKEAGIRTAYNSLVGSRQTKANVTDESHKIMVGVDIHKARMREFLNPLLEEIRKQIMHGERTNYMYNVCGVWMHDQPSHQSGYLQNIIGSDAAVVPIGNITSIDLYPGSIEQKLLELTRDVIFNSFYNEYLECIIPYDISMEIVYTFAYDDQLIFDPATNPFFIQGNTFDTNTWNEVQIDANTCFQYNYVDENSADRVYVYKKIPLDFDNLNHLVEKDSLLLNKINKWLINESFDPNHPWKRINVNNYSTLCCALNIDNEKEDKNDFIVESDFDEKTDAPTHIQLTHKGLLRLLVELEILTAPVEMTMGSSAEKHVSGEGEQPLLAADSDTEEDNHSFSDVAEVTLNEGQDLEVDTSQGNSSIQS